MNPNRGPVTSDEPAPGPPATSTGVDITPLEEFDHPVDQLATPDTRRVDVDQVRREALRWVLIMFCGILALGATGALMGDTTWANTKDFLNTTFASVVGLVGTVVGFYFGRGSGTGGQS